MTRRCSSRNDIFFVHTTLRKRHEKSFRRCSSKRASERASEQATAMIPMRSVCQPVHIVFFFPLFSREMRLAAAYCVSASGAKFRDELRSSDMMTLEFSSSGHASRRGRRLCLRLCVRSARSASLSLEFPDVLAIDVANSESEYNVKQIREADIDYR